MCIRDRNKRYEWGVYGVGGGLEDIDIHVHTHTSWAYISSASCNLYISWAYIYIYMFSLQPAGLTSAQPQRVQTSKIMMIMMMMMMVMKAAHRAYHETKTNINACIERADMNPYVGPKLIQDLKENLKDSTKKDAALAKQEVAEKNGKVWNESDCKTIRTLIREVKDLIDAAKSLIKKVEAITKD